MQSTSPVSVSKGSSCHSVLNKWQVIDNHPFVIVVVMMVVILVLSAACITIHCQRQKVIKQRPSDQNNGQEDGWSGGNGQKCVYEVTESAAPQDAMRLDERYVLGPTATQDDYDTAIEICRAAVDLSDAGKGRPAVGVATSGIDAEEDTATACNPVFADENLGQTASSRNNSASQRSRDERDNSCYINFPVGCDSKPSSRHNSEIIAANTPRKSSTSTAGHTDPVTAKSHPSEQMTGTNSRVQRRSSHHHPRDSFPVASVSSFKAESEPQGETAESTQAAGLYVNRDIISHEATYLDFRKTQ